MEMPKSRLEIFMMIVAKDLRVPRAFNQANFLESLHAGQRIRAHAYELDNNVLEFNHLCASLYISFHKLLLIRQ